MKKQFEFQKNVLKLSVDKPHIVLRIFLFFLAFCTFFLPFFGIVISLSSGGGLHIGYLIGLGIFSLLAFYLLRISLWNTFGQETFIFNEKEIVYEADYGWFKDGKATILMENIQYSIDTIGYEEENLGVLILNNEEKRIQSVVKIPKKQLDELLYLLRNLDNTHFLD